jgi:hypothetical protein
MFSVIEMQLPTEIALEYPSDEESGSPFGEVHMAAAARTVPADTEAWDVGAITLSQRLTQAGGLFRQADGFNDLSLFIEHDDSEGQCFHGFAT